MIISKTPYRISFFGGGSDYPQWYNRYDGSVLSTTIDKHIYITCRHLPNFFNHKFRIIWSKLEQVKKINQIQHKAVRMLLEELKIKKGLEIHYDGDLPARSGMGSSSCFVVGLSKVLFEILKIKKNKKQLANFTIDFEHNTLNEIVGSQDQTATVYGGFNRINFKKNRILVKKIKNKNNLNRLNKNLMLLYTGIQRNAPDVAKKYVNTLTLQNKKSINQLIKHVNEGEKIINNGNIDDFGYLLDEAWHYKKEISRNISNPKIDEIYKVAKKNGALGGKLLGAGGGGFMLFYVKSNKQKDFLKKNKKLLNIPFNFSEKGSEIIFNHTK
jgi:D-glycero-alpha-D-manno-heptose-7-phosphate kinase